MAAAKRRKTKSKKVWRPSKKKTDWARHRRELIAIDGLLGVGFSSREAISILRNGIKKGS